MNKHKLPKTKDCILELENSWLTIWFNRPEKNNALSNNLIEEIIHTLTVFKHDQSVRGIIFRGKGNIFCAGADLKELKNISISKKESSELAYQMSKKIGLLFQMINTSPQIIISIVEGAAMAGAFGIVCSSDFIISTKSARYALSETKLGLVPAQIAPFVLVKLGLSQGKKLLLLGEMFDGSEAHEKGLVDYLVDEENEIDDFLNIIKSNIKSCAPNAISITKEIISNNININIEKAAEIFSNSINHKEGIDGLASFFEKRKPFWNKN
jgi:isohexenylglutaconyl-CoA hydratase